MSLPDHDKNLPAPPSLFKTLGPSFILLGLALGSGELILWPFLTARWGFGLLWGALLGITFQFILNTEIMRYSLAWGESVFVGFRRLSHKLPYWFIVSTFIPWALPGFSSATAQIFSRLFGWQNQTVIAIIFLLLVGVVLSIGKTLYRTMELLQRTVILLGLPLITAFVVFFTHRADWAELALGLVGKGTNWWFFPPGVAVASFLGAFAYAGAGGNLNLAQSYYIKEKGFGMGKFSSKISSLFSKENKQVHLEGDTFAPTPLNKVRWRAWWRIVNTEHLIVFWGLGFLTIVLLAILSKVLVFGQTSPDGIEFLYQEAQVITQTIGGVFGVVFLLVAALMLYSTQLGVLESSSRIISENVLLIAHRQGKKVNASLAFYIALWGQILLGIVVLLFGFREPRFLLTLAAVLNAVAMMVSFPLVYFLNKKRLTKLFQPHWARKATMLGAFLFFLVFSIITLMQTFS